MGCNTRLTRSMMKLSDKNFDEKETATGYNNDNTMRPVSETTEKYDDLREEYESINNVIKTLGLQLENANSEKLELINQHNDDHMEFDRICKENVNLKTQLARLKNEMDESVSNHSNAISRLAEYEKERSQFKDINDYVTSLEKKIAKYERTVEFHSKKQEELLLNSIQNETKKDTKILKLIKSIKEKEAECTLLNESLKEKESVIANCICNRASIPFNCSASTSKPMLHMDTKDIPVQTKLRKNKIAKKETCHKSDANKKPIKSRVCQKTIEHRHKNQLDNTNKDFPRVTKAKATDINVSRILDTEAPTRKKSKIVHQPSLTNMTTKNKGNKYHVSKPEEQIKQRKVLILTDENGKMCAGLLKDMLPKYYQVTSITKTNAQLFGVCNVTKNIMSNLDKNDYVIVMGGVHYSYLNNQRRKEHTHYLLETYLNTLCDSTKNTNIIICSVPYRLDDNRNNYDICDINTKIYSIALSNKHVTFVQLADILEEVDYVARGTHLNLRGKGKFTTNIKDAILKDIKNKQPPKNGPRTPTPQGRR